MDQLLRESRPALAPTDLAAVAAALARTTTAWAHLAEGPPSERRTELLLLDDDMEAWAIHWPPGTGLELHDHGTSAGACVVVTGSLVEAVPSATGIRSRTLEAGRSATFPVGHVHDVTNLGAVTATSVHVYSPPLRSMTFYALEAGDLTPTRTDHLA